MAKIQTLRDREDSTIYPQTSSEAVRFNDGRTAEQKVSDINESLDGKQEKFTTSEDLQLSETNELGLTERAKIDWIVQYATHRGAKYDADNNTFSLNDLTGISIPEMLEIIRYDGANFMGVIGVYMNSSARTFFPINSNPTGWNSTLTSDCTFLQCSNLEKVQFITNTWYASKNLRHVFYECKKLREIGVVIKVAATSIFENTFQRCLALEEVRINNLQTNGLSFADSPLLSLNSVKYLVDNAANKTLITVTVHPDVYAKLTDQSNAEWFALLEAAQAKNISFATV